MADRSTAQVQVEHPDGADERERLRSVGALRGQLRLARASQPTCHFDDFNPCRVADLRFFSPGFRYAVWEHLASLRAAQNDILHEIGRVHPVWTTREDALAVSRILRDAQQRNARWLERRNLEALEASADKNDEGEDDFDLARRACANVERYWKSLQSQYKWDQVSHSLGAGPAALENLTPRTARRYGLL